MSNLTALYAALLLVALHVALPVEAKPANLRLAFMDRKGADAAEARPDELCFVETGKGKARRRTPYILDLMASAEQRCPPFITRRNFANT